MKKCLLKSIIMGGLLLLSQEIFAQASTVILHWGENAESAGNMPRSPMRPLTLGLDGRTLNMSNVGFDCQLQILDEDENVVYTTFVTANTTTVVLPATLSGNYEIRLITDEYYFTGWIDL